MNTFSTSKLVALPILGLANLLKLTPSPIQFGCALALVLLVPISSALAQDAVLSLRRESVWRPDSPVAELLGGARNGVIFADTTASAAPIDSRRQEPTLPAAVIPERATDAVVVSMTSSSSGAGNEIDASSISGLQLGELPAALGFPEELLVEGGSSPAIRAAKGVVQSLDIASALALGVETSLDLAASDAALRGANARTQGAFAQLLPKVDLRRAEGSGSYTGGATNFATKDRSEASVDFRLPLFFPAGWMELRRQKTLESVAEFERDAKKSAAALDNGLAFLAILSSQGRLNLTDEHRKRLRGLFEYTRARVEGGLSAPTESNRVESRIVGVEADMSEAKANLRGALSNYVRLTEYLPKALSFRNPLPPLPPGMTDLQLLELVKENPELLASRKRSDSHREEIRAGRSNFLPRVDFQASRIRSDNVGAVLGRQTESKAMVVMTVSLFSGGGDVAQITEANAKLDEQTLRGDLMERQLRSDVETTLAGLSTLGGRYSAIVKQVKLDAAVVDSFTDQLRLGNRPLLDVLDAHQRLYQSRQQLLLIGITQAQAFLRMSYLTGRLAGTTNFEPKPEGK